MSPFKPEDLLTRAEAAQYLRLSVSTLANAASNKTGPQITIIGTRTVRYRKADLDAWIEASASKARARENERAVQAKITAKAAMADLQRQKENAGDTTREVMINGLQQLLDQLKTRR